MPMYRVFGDVRIAFIHTVEADSEEAAEELVSDLRISALDSTNEKEGMEIQGCDELDEDGNEAGS